MARNLMARLPCLACEFREILTKLFLFFNSTIIALEKLDNLIT